MNTQQQTSKNTYVWYEKTIEYIFARKYMEVQAMPLDGYDEKFGDSIFFTKDVIYLIEFKRGMNISNDKTAERAKFENADTASTELKKLPFHKKHFVVYGVMQPEGNPRSSLKDFLEPMPSSYPTPTKNTNYVLSLKKEIYCEFIKTQITGCNLAFANINQITPDSIAINNSIKNFENYLNKLIELKKPHIIKEKEKKGSKSSSEDIFTDFNNMLIINEYGHAVLLSTLYDIGEDFKIKVKHKCEYKPHKADITDANYINTDALQQAFTEEQERKNDNKQQKKIDNTNTSNTYNTVKRKP